MGTKKIKKLLKVAGTVAMLIPGGQPAGAGMIAAGEMLPEEAQVENEVRSAKKKNYIQNYKRG